MCNRLKCLQIKGRESSGELFEQSLLRDSRVRVWSISAFTTVKLCVRAVKTEKHLEQLSFGRDGAQEKTRFVNVLIHSDLGEAAVVLAHHGGVGTLQLLDDLKALVELREDVHHRAGEQSVLRRRLELRMTKGNGNIYIHVYCPRTSIFSHFMAALLLIS